MLGVFVGSSFEQGSPECEKKRGGKKVAMNEATALRGDSGRRGCDLTGLGGLITIPPKLERVYGVVSTAQLAKAGQDAWQLAGQEVPSAAMLGHRVGEQGKRVVHVSLTTLSSDTRSGYPARHSSATNMRVAKTAVCK